MSSAGAADERAGVCHSVQRSVLGSATAKGPWQAEQLEPAHEGVGEADDGEPGPVGVDVDEREAVGAGVLEAADVVFDVGVGAHVRGRGRRGHRRRRCSDPSSGTSWRGTATAGRRGAGVRGARSGGCPSGQSDRSTKSVSSATGGAGAVLAVLAKGRLPTLVVDDRPSRSPRGSGRWSGRRRRSRRCVPGSATRSRCSRPSRCAPAPPGAPAPRRRRRGGRRRSRRAAGRSPRPTRRRGRRSCSPRRCPAAASPPESRRWHRRSSRSDGTRSHPCSVAAASCLVLRVDLVQRRVDVQDHRGGARRRRRAPPHLGPHLGHRLPQPGQRDGSIWRKVRYSVESDGTAPNNAGWARRCSMSAHASPPRRASTSPASAPCPDHATATAHRPAGSPPTSESPTPSRSANDPRRCNPTWATT